MSSVEILRFAVRALVANRLRSLLTMLGIIIGIAAVILLTALGNGAARFIQSQITGLGANSITVIARAASGTAGAKAGASSRPLTPADAAALADPQGAPDVAYVAPVVQTSVTVASGPNSESDTVIGSTPDYFPGSNQIVASGRGYDRADLTTARPVAVLGRTVADDMFGVGSVPLGRTVLLNGSPFQVIGVLQAKGQGGPGANPDSNVLAPLSAVQSTFTGFGNLNQIVVGARSAEAQNAAESEVYSILDRRHGITNPNDRDYQLISSAQIAQVLDQTLSAFSLLLAGIAGILAAGGWHRDHQHHAGLGHRADPGDRHPEGPGRAAVGDPRPVPRRGGDPLGARRADRGRDRDRGVAHPAPGRVPRGRRPDGGRRRRRGVHRHRGLLRWLPGAPRGAAAPDRGPAT